MGNMIINIHSVAIVILLCMTVEHLTCFLLAAKMPVIKEVTDGHSEFFICHVDVSTFRELNIIHLINLLLPYQK